MGKSTVGPSLGRVGEEIFSTNVAALESHNTSCFGATEVDDLRCAAGEEAPERAPVEPFKCGVLLPLDEVLPRSVSSFSFSLQYRNACLVLSKTVLSSTISKTVQAFLRPGPFILVGLLIFRRKRPPLALIALTVSRTIFDFSERRLAASKASLREATSFRNV